MTTHEIFHTLWSQAQGQPGYVKADWKEVDNLLDIRTSFTAAAVQAFDRIIKTAAKSATYDEALWTQLAKHLYLEKHIPKPDMT